jgi:hypothetical protein
MNIFTEWLSIAPLTEWKRKLIFTELMKLNNICNSHTNHFTFEARSCIQTFSGC